jgi:DNA gyrase subunit A
VQADAILRMTLGQLVNLEQERLAGEHAELLKEITEYLRILSDDENIRTIIREELGDLKKRFADERRTEITGEEIGSINLEDLIEEENMVVSISHKGYIKRTPASVYRAQRRGGKGLKGAKTEEEDPIEHLFVASTHAYLLFFTNLGRVYWQKVYDLPELSRDSRGRAIVNLLNLGEGEKVAECLAVRDFSPGHYLMMATRKGLIKKTPLEDYSRPKRGGIIAIKLRPDDEVVDVVVTRPGDEVILATARGMAIRFSEADARPMGRNTSGVKGISLMGTDHLVGMVVADPEATLLTVCEKGYGKRTNFGPHADVVEGPPPADENGVEEAAASEPPEEASEESEEEGDSSSRRYRTQRRGGKGVRDIKTTTRNGNVIGISRVDDGDEVLMMTGRGKLQRIAAADISVIGRNTQGVRIMSLDEGDSLVAVVRVPKEEESETPLAVSSVGPPPSDVIGPTVVETPHAEGEPPT